MNTNSEAIKYMLQYNCKTEQPFEEQYDFLQKNVSTLGYILAKLSGYCVDLIVNLRAEKMENLEYDIDYDLSFKNITLAKLSRCDIDTNNIIFIPIVIIFYKGSERLLEAHSTLLIIDNVDKTIEYYEPNGFPNWNNDIEGFLEFEVEENYPDHTFIPTSDFCPNIGPQGILNEGICSAFTLFFIWARTFEPELTTIDLFNELTKIGKVNIRKIIYNFICYINDLIDQQNLKEMIEVMHKMIYAIRDKHSENPTKYKKYGRYLNAALDAFYDLDYGLLVKNYNIIMSI